MNWPMPLSLPGSQAGDCCLRVSTKCLSAREILLQHKNSQCSYSHHLASTLQSCFGPMISPILLGRIFVAKIKELRASIHCQLWYSSNLSRLDGICLYHQLMLHQALWPRNFSSSLARIDPRGSWFQHVSNLQLHQQHYEITMSIYHQIWTSMIWFHTFLERHFEIYHNSHLTFMGDHTNPAKLSRPRTWRYSNDVCLCNGEGMFWSVGWFLHWFQVFKEQSSSSLSPLYHHLPFTACVNHLGKLRDSQILQRAQLYSWSRLNLSVALVVTAAPDAHLGGWQRHMSLGMLPPGIVP